MNQNPEQIARDSIDRQLRTCGWIIQNRSGINLNEGPGIAIREYPTDIGPADYVHAPVKLTTLRRSKLTTSKLVS